LLSYASIIPSEIRGHIVKKADTNFLPVVQRELREGARRPFNYWLRVAGAAAGMLLFYQLHLTLGGNQTAAGLRLFTSLHQMMLVLICLIVPAISADCISSEKREGTLGLLFLTPLTAMGIIVGKGLVQMFRAFTLWLAVVPVLTVLFLLGGVTATDVISALAIEFCVTLLCLSAGIMASALTKTRYAALLLAASLTFFLLAGFSVLLEAAFDFQVYNIHASGPILITGLPTPPAPMLPGSFISTPFPPAVSMGSPVIRTRTNPIQYAPITQSVIGNGPSWARSITGTVVPTPITRTPTVVTPQAGWASYASTPANRTAWYSILLECLFAVPLLFYLALRLAAHQMANSWQEKGPSVRRESWIKAYCVPIARERFTRKLQRLLDSNPIAWL
jgi:ABC-type transport system involved in multi-copper enzyme maturation permease subunit